MERRITPTACWCGAALALLVLLGNAVPVAAQGPPASGWTPRAGEPVPNDFSPDNHDGGELKFTGTLSWEISGYYASTTQSLTFQKPPGRTEIQPHYEIWSINSMTGKLSGQVKAGQVLGTYPNYTFPTGALPRFQSYLFYVKEVPTGTPQLTYTIWKTVTPP
jgi:hypothetical protein